VSGQDFNNRIDRVIARVPHAFKGPRLHTVKAGPAVSRCGGDPDRIVWRGVILAWVAFAVILWATK
jgi:hypothetical protein